MPSRAAGAGLTPFLRHVLEHRLIQSEIGDHLPEPAILLLGLLDAPELGHPHAGVFPLPAVEGRLTAAERAAEPGHGGALLGLAQGLGDLPVGVAGLRLAVQLLWVLYGTVRLEGEGQLDRHDERDEREDDDQLEPRVHGERAEQEQRRGAVEHDRHKQTPLRVEGRCSGPGARDSATLLGAA